MFVALREDDLGYIEFVEIASGDWLEIAKHHIQSLLS
jgi:hypothetical protein